MGHRLHVAKKYEVEYSLADNFNIENALKELEEPLPEIIEFMELLFEEADQNHEFMVLSFH